MNRRDTVYLLVGFMLALIFVQVGMTFKRALTPETPKTAAPVAMATAGVTITAQVTPCPTPNLKGKVWQQRTQCFEYEEYQKKHGDYPPKIYDFINEKTLALFDKKAKGECAFQYDIGKTPELMEGCVTYWDLVEPHAPLVKWTVKIKRKEPIVKYVWKTYDVTVKASDDYLARKVANKQLDDENGTADDSISVSTKRVK